MDSNSDALSLIYKQALELNIIIIEKKYLRLFNASYIVLLMWSFFIECRIESIKVL